MAAAHGVVRRLFVQNTAEQKRRVVSSLLKHNTTTRQHNNTTRQHDTVAVFGFI